MYSWRTMFLGALILFPLAAYSAVVTSPWLVAPPLLTALLVLFAAAMAVDYFGLARRRETWGGLCHEPDRAWRRARTLERRFLRQRRRGSPHTAWTARSLLVALAQCDRLDESLEVIDFLGADALFVRVGSDVTADALRAVALAELGRSADARALCGRLDGYSRVRARPVVLYAKARVAVADSRYAEARIWVESALQNKDLPAAARRDLEILRGRVLARMWRPDEASSVLAGVVQSGFRREVELLAERSHARGDSQVAAAAHVALTQASPYR